MKKVTGIGGVFFKCHDPEVTKEWYRDHLGLAIDAYGSTFESRDSNNPKQKTYLQWSPFKKDTTYFEPSEKEFMINYRVDNLERLIEELRENGVTICGEIQKFDYGKFAHIMDPDGNKLELWEPVDKVLTDHHGDHTTK